MSERRQRATREIRVEDPDLSLEATRLLTAELRAAVGGDKVSADRADTLLRVPRAGQAALGSVLGANRALIAISFAALLVIGIILTLVTGSWWAVVGA